MKTNKLISVLLLSFLLIISAKAMPPIEEGKTLFLSRCAACHTINKNMTGPALSGIDTRRTIDWIIQFVHSSKTMMKGGDKDALAIFEKFNKVPMPDHPDLTDENIKSIVAYIKSESKPLNAEKPPFSKPGKKQTAYQPLTINNYFLFTSYFAVVAALIATLYFAMQLKTFQRKKKDTTLSA